MSQLGDQTCPVRVPSQSDSMTEYCKEIVSDRDLRGISHRCHNKAKKDGYCGIHHPDAVKRRREKADARYKKWSEGEKAKYARQDFDRRAGNRCREIGIQPEEIK